MLIDKKTKQVYKKINLNLFPEINLLFQKWDQLANEPCEATLMGGTAIGITFDFPRFTQDVDIAISAKNMKPNQNVIHLLGHQSEFRKQNQYYLQFVDDQIFFNEKNWMERRWLLKGPSFQYLQLFSLSPEDFVISKMGDRFNIKDQEDIIYMLQSNLVDIKLFFNLLEKLKSQINHEDIIMIEKQELWIRQFLDKGS